MTKYKLLTPAIILTLIFAFTSCKQSGTSSTGTSNSITNSGGAEAKEAEVIPEDIVELRADQIALAKIDTGPFEIRSMSSSLKVSGMVSASPQNMAMVCMPMGGFVKSTSLVQGDAVSKGQVLAVLENQEFVDIQLNYVEAKIKLEYAKADFDRQSELFKNDVSSEKNMQQVTSNYKSLRAQVSGLEQKLALIGIDPSKLNEDNISRSVSLVSPISGNVKTVNVSIGKYVSSSDVLFEIVNNNNLYLELTLFEKDAVKVSKGQKIHFYINNETEQHEAIIYQTGKSINADNTYKLYARVSGYCKNMLPGMYANAIIDATDNKVAALPSDAIVSFDDKFYIFVFELNKEEGGKPFTEYRIVEVKEGVKDGGFTEVILPEGFDITNAKVVVKGAYNLLSAKKNAGEMSCG